MAYRDLRDFLRTLEKKGELKRISEEVDPILEITEITDRTVKAEGPALLFEKPRGSKIPVVTNLVGTERRMNLALEVESLDEVADRIHSFLDMQSPQGIFEKMKMLPKLAELGSFFPKTVRSGECQEVVREKDFSLSYFPILQCWPQDGGRYITWPMVITKNPETGKRNVGCYRMQVFDERTTGMHWQTQKHGAEHFRSARAKNREGKLEVAVAIGADPATCLAGILPVPPDMDEFLFSGFLRRDPVELVACKTVDLEVPANAEIVLEGYVELGELRTEGPFGDHTGFYTMQDDYPVFHVTCITHRKDPVYAATIVGKPPMEDAWMGKAVERIFLPLMQLTMPEIVDVNLPPEGVFHNLMIVAIKKSYAGHARKVMNGIWAMGQAMFTKCIIVVDEDCDVQDLAEVTLRTTNNIDPERDIQFTLGPVDSLDHASRLPNFGSKMGIDATRKWSAEGFSRPWPPMLTMDAGVKSKVDAIWKKLGIE